ncbi:MAG: 2Fe-2S iron-sulfur cluster-binding protein [Planctomycetota bacterium]|nr:2Fe-2S iron-sulfur cluster-binding protein [Planctomycetota bacterium]
MALIKTTIDGREVQVERDRWAIDVAREMGIDIPTLCHHPALEPYGACRLCVVEVTKGKWTWLTTSCDLPIREGLNIRTDTPAVIAARKMAIELLWAQAPDAVEVQALAKQLGMEKPRFAARAEAGKCILCGLCVRVCKAVLGQPAVGFSRRGVERDIGAPFDKPSDTCIGCGACVAVCPTGHITSVEDGPLWRLNTSKTEAELELAKCPECGRRFAPVKQIEFIRKTLSDKPERAVLDQICPACRKARTAAGLSESSRERRICLEK